MGTVKKAPARVILDASALIAYLVKERGFEKIRTLLASDESVSMVASNVSEVVDHLLRVRGIPSADVSAALKPLFDTRVSVIDVDMRIAWGAGEVRAAQYHHENFPVSLADTAPLAALTQGDTLLTRDVSQAKVGQRLGLQVEHF